MTTATKEKKTTHFVFPRKLLLEIDKLAGKRKRSAFVLEATKEKLARENFDKVLRDGAGVWTDKNHPDLMTDKDVNKFIRDFRELSDKRLEGLYE